tara:strand:- start:370 stop:522 length:153 start_codon:yes stop_codon:yes gene_type:complete
MMTDKEIEQWLRDNPWKVNVIYPAGAIGFMMFVMYSCMQIIDSFLTGSLV